MNFNLPTEQECLDLFKKYVVPENIVHHCLKVQQVSVFMGQKLKEQGKLLELKSINLDFVSRLALCHDMFKMAALNDITPNKYHQRVFNEQEVAMWKYLREKYPQMYEGDVGYEIFKDTYPEFALSLKRVSSPWIDNPTWEEIIVHYCDWRVFQEKVVSLVERMAYLREYYSRNQIVWNEYEVRCKAQEEKIFFHLDFKPDDLSIVLENEVKAGKLNYD